MGVEKKRFIKRDLYINIFNKYEDKIICYKLINDKKYDYDNISSKWIRINGIKINFFEYDFRILIPNDYIEKFLEWKEFKNFKRKNLFKFRDFVLVQLNYNIQDPKIALRLLNYMEINFK